MVLSTLTLQNFRSYPKELLKFTPGTTIVAGANAAGKTNILEAIMFLATGKSFRAGKEAELMRWGSDVSTVVCQVKNADDVTRLDLLITKGEISGIRAPHKKFLVNGVSRRMVDFVGHLRAVLFWPEDLELVTDSPGVRRRYLDTVLLQADREYRRNLLSYERGLRQRNKLLDSINEGIATRAQLLFWDQLLIKTGEYITSARSSFISYINGTKLAEHEFHMEYDKSVISVARLEQYKDEEVSARYTLVGPHRDDFALFSREHSDEPGLEMRHLGKFGSRGEQRLAVLWLKLAEMAYMEQQTGSRPMLLLDDIFSELDENHRSLVGGVVSQQQTIITSADVESVPADVRRHAVVIRV